MRGPLNENRVPKDAKEMIRLYTPLVLNVCKGDRDLVWEIWGDVFTRLGKYNPEKGSFHQWLWVTVSRERKQILRKRAAAEKAAEALVELTEDVPAPSFEAAMEARDELAHLRTIAIAEAHPVQVSEKRRRNGCGRCGLRLNSECQCHRRAA